MRSNNQSYVNIGDGQSVQPVPIPWYWRVIALAGSWMILGGYLLLPGLYAKDPQLKFPTAVLSVFVVALLTAGYSFTALLCFACRDLRFQADGIFLPALTSSAFGLVSIAYNFLSSHAYVFDISAISGAAVSGTATLTYGALLLWTHRRIVKAQGQSSSRSANLWSEPSYYSNFVQNMYPTARSPFQPPEAGVTEDDRVNQQMALLLMRSDSRPSPDANRATFNIDLPGAREEEERHARSQELVGTPGPIHTRPDNLGEQQAWERLQDRGRTTHRPPSAGAGSSHSRNLSREERRREIELGHV
ncbi:hypothetical protein ACN47E_006168 [Coniothyrium glycines]